jgi:hypothetical protein
VALIPSLSGAPLVHAGDDPCGEPNDTASTPCSLDQDVQVQGFISSFEDQDAYAIEVPAGANLRVDMVPPGDYRIGLLRPDGSEVVKPQGEGVAPRQFRVARASGPYVIHIFSNQGDSSPDLPYKLSYTLEPDSAGRGQPELVQARPVDLILTLDEAGKQAEKKKTENGTDATGPWYQIEYERPRTYANDRSGAIRIVERIIVSPDIETAQRAFEEQSKRDFPEAAGFKRAGNFYPNVGPLGDDFAIVLSLQSLDEKEPDVHHQIIIRYANAVIRLYTFGYAGDGGATTDNAMDLARMALKHLR